MTMNKGDRVVLSHTFNREDLARTIYGLWAPWVQEASVMERLPATRRWLSGLGEVLVRASSEGTEALPTFVEIGSTKAIEELRSAEGRIDVRRGGEPLNPWRRSQLLYVCWFTAVALEKEAKVACREAKQD